MFNLTVHHNDKTETIQELRALCNSNQNFSLKNYLNGSKLEINWPHQQPKPTGEVRTKLISARMQINKKKSIMDKDIPKGKMLNTVSTMLVLLITVPAVAFSVFVLCRWFGVEKERAKQYGILSGLASLFVELGLAIIQMFKEDRCNKLLERFLSK